jgi:hypothetical protein
MTIRKYVRMLYYGTITKQLDLVRGLKLSPQNTRLV